mmetsp:Transcript_42396/g.85785  ORF Transcript_42396/g.85785 Transcript_42396/m.85785 type:complete len:290 (-) Transcript_42396:553-1422(-)
MRGPAPAPPPPFPPKPPAVSSLSPWPPPPTPPPPSESGDAPWPPPWYAVAVDRDANAPSVCFGCASSAGSPSSLDTTESRDTFSHSLYVSHVKMTGTLRALAVMATTAVPARACTAPLDMTAAAPRSTLVTLGMAYDNALSQQYVQGTPAWVSLSSKPLPSRLGLASTTTTWKALPRACAKKSTCSTACERPNVSTTSPTSLNLSTASAAMSRPAASTRSRTKRSTSSHTCCLASCSGRFGSRLLTTPLKNCFALPMLTEWGRQSVKNWNDRSIFLSRSLSSALPGGVS